MNLATGEFFAICIFIYMYSLFNLGVSSFIAFLYLLFILFQGSVYWFYRYILLIKGATPNIKVIKLLRVFRLVNMILVLAIGIAIPIYKADMKDLVSALGLFLFGAIEYVNYYWYRLSYGKSGFNVKILFQTKLQKSNINKMINLQ